MVRSVATTTTTTTTTGVEKNEDDVGSSLSLVANAATVDVFCLLFLKLCRSCASTWCVDRMSSAIASRRVVSTTAAGRTENGYGVNDDNDDDDDDDNDDDDDHNDEDFEDDNDSGNGNGFGDGKGDVYKLCFFLFFTYSSFFK